MSEVDPTVPLCTEPRILGGIYSRFGVGKSAFGQAAARWVQQNLGLKTRLVLADPGSFDPYASGIDEGYIQHMSADAWTNFPPNVLYKLLAEGYWPEDVSTPNSRLVPGYTELRLCPKCGQDSGSYSAGHAIKCASCGVDFPAGRTLPITRRLTSLAGVGLVIFEGFSVISASLLDSNRESRPGDSFYVGGSTELWEIARRANDALKKSTMTKEDNDIIKEAKRLENEGLLQLSKGSAADHYLKAQQDIMTIITHSKKLPVPYVLWTAHEGIWDEPIEKGKMNSAKRVLGLGPQIPVMKRIKDVGRSFTFLGHIVADEKTGARTLYLDAHPSEYPGIPWLAKCNVLGMPKAIPLGDPLKVNNWGVFMDAYDKAKKVVLP